MIDLEVEWLNRPQHDGSKGRAIAARLGLTETTYYQILARLTRDPDAMAYAPSLLRHARERVTRRRRRR